MSESRVTSVFLALILAFSVPAAAQQDVRPSPSSPDEQAARSAVLDRVFELGESLGSGWVQVGGALGTFVVGRSIDNPRVKSLGIDLVRAQATTALLTQGLKLAVRRTRPDGGRFSFPSGHASGSFATATVLERHLGWKVGIPAYAVAGYVAASRVQERRHYPSDVIVGAAVGIISARTVTVGRGSARFAMSVVPLPGGGGVSFGRIPIE